MTTEVTQALHPPSSLASHLIVADPRAVEHYTQQGELIYQSQRDLRETLHIYECIKRVAPNNLHSREDWLTLGFYMYVLTFIEQKFQAMYHRKVTLFEKAFLFKHILQNRDTRQELIRLWLPAQPSATKHPVQKSLGE
jgi:hypothetical protein